MRAAMTRVEALLALARLVDTFPLARLGETILIGTLLDSGANSTLARCYGPRWFDLTGDEAGTACCLAAALERAGDVPPFGLFS